MIFFGVVQKYYDNGEVTANVITIEADEKPQDHFEERRNYDLYIDYFEDEKKAEALRELVTKV